jgi:hypothetical protein
LIAEISVRALWVLGSRVPFERKMQQLRQVHWFPAGSLLDLFAAAESI